MGWVADAMGWLGLDFFERIRLINWIRKTVRINSPCLRLKIAPSLHNLFLVRRSLRRLTSSGLTVASLRSSRTTPS